mmetsp:Transcript_14740/g.40755  ORF Transcript_14740/g.40755 Transcript_14740/m.40755 type:complete len:243 (+) Transcript_14740:572-1300(+)
MNETESPSQLRIQQLIPARLTFQNAVDLLFARRFLHLLHLARVNFHAMQMALVLFRAGKGLFSAGMVLQPLPNIIDHLLQMTFASFVVFHDVFALWMSTGMHGSDDNDVDRHACVSCNGCCTLRTLRAIRVLVLQAKTQHIVVPSCKPRTISTVLIYYSVWYNSMHATLHSTQLFADDVPTFRIHGCTCQCALPHADGSWRPCYLWFQRHLAAPRTPVWTGDMPQPRAVSCNERRSSLCSIR